MRTPTTASQHSLSTRTVNQQDSATYRDPQTTHILRTLGEAALRLADGQPLDDVFVAPHDSDLRPSSAPAGDLLTVPEVCERLRISRWMFYRLLHQQRIATITIGRRRLVASREVDRFVRSQSSDGGPR